MKKTWEVREANANFSEIIKQAITNGTQKITLQGEFVAVVLSNKEYEKLKGYKTSIVDFMKNSPFYGINLDLIRDKSLHHIDIDG